MNKRKLQQCGKCPGLMCERFSRFKDPDLSEKEAKAVLLRVEQELRMRKWLGTKIL